MGPMKQKNRNTGSHSQRIGIKAGKALITAAIYLLVIISVYCLVQLRYTSSQRHFSLKTFAAVTILIVASGVIHQRRKGRLSVREYVKTLFLGKTVNQKRIVYMDYLRILATVLVIAVHVMEPAYQQMDGHTPIWGILAVITSLFCCCNLLFMMISGALLLNGKNESIWLFYKKRFLKVGIPCFAYYCFYCFYINGITAFYPDKWLALIGSFTANNTGMTPHFWLVHVILVFYITAPFFAIMMKAMTEAQKVSLAVLVFILHCLFTYMPYCQINFLVIPFLSSWESIFILGYFCTTKSAMKYYRLIMAGGGLSVLFVVYAVYTMEDFPALLYNNAPTMLMIASAVFLFFRTHGEGIFSRISPVMQSVSKYSFSILLIHWCILFEVVEKGFGINGLSFGIGGGIIASVVLTLVISMVFSIFYDNTVVLCVNYIADRAIGIFERLAESIIRKVRRN